jgi:branched-chain amino acid transport system substrate-binding protein
MRLLRVFPALLALVLLAVLPACKPRGAADGGEGSGGGGANDLVIGAFLSMTGSKADFGIETARGAQIAVDEANAAGGVHGRQVRMVVVDDQGNADEAGSAVQRLIDVEGAVAILGEVSSSLSLVGGRIAQRRQIPMVSPSSTNTQVTEIGDFVFRVCFIDPFQGFVMAKFARENLGLTQVAIFKDVRNDYSIGLATSFRDAFVGMGGTIVAEESYNEGDTDFSAQLTTMRATNPQAIFVPGYYSEVGNIARQSRQLGMTVPLLGGDGWDSPQLREIGGADIVGSYYSNHFAADNPAEQSRAFIENFTRIHGQPPSGLAALGYDAARTIIDAMARASDPTPVAIRDQLVTTNLALVSGTITFDPSRNPVKPAVVVQVGATGDTFVAEIRPNP